MRLCENFALGDVLPDQWIVKKAFRNVTPTLVSFLDNCVYETKATQLLAELEWPKDLD